MSFEPDVLQGFVQRYLDTVAGGSADDVAALYAEDATLEDPVGGGDRTAGDVGATTCAFVTTNPVRATKPDPSLPPEHSRDIDRTLTTAPETAEIRTAPRIRGLGGSTGRIRSSPTPTATVAIPSRLTRRCSGALSAK